METGRRELKIHEEKFRRAVTWLFSPSWEMYIRACVMRVVCQNNKARLFFRGAERFHDTSQGKYNLPRELNEDESCAPPRALSRFAMYITFTYLRLHIFSKIRFS